MGRRDGFAALTWTRRRWLGSFGAISLLGHGALGRSALSHGSPGIESGAGPGARTNDGTSAQGWLPAPPARPGGLLLVDLTGLAGHTQAALAILQGAVNRLVQPGGEAIYLLVPADYAGGVAVPGVDRRWASLYAAEQGLRLREGTPADALALARRAGIDRYVVWDPQVPATINVATTLAWVLGTAAVAPEDAASPFRGPLATVMAYAGLNLAGNGWKEALDLRALRLPDAAAAYRWALGQLRGRRPRSLALLAVGDLPGDATEGVLRWTARDYAVSAEAFAWEIAFPSTPAPVGGPPLDAVDAEVLRAAGPGRRTIFGWSNNETDQTEMASAHGFNFVGADTPGLPAENLSVHSALPATARQQPRAAAPALDPRGVYAAIVFTDGDNISVLIDFHEGRWLDPDRGRVPVGWSLQGMAPSWTPALAAHYFASATPQDEFVSWLPFGYPDLPSFVGHPHWGEYVASAQAAMRTANLQVSQSLPHTARVLSAQASGLWDLMHGGPEGHFLGYTEISGYPAGQPLWIDARPVLPVGGYGGSGSGVRSAIAALETTMAEVRERPLFLVLGLANGTSYADAERLASAPFAEPVRFVLPSQLVGLMRAAWRQGLARSTPLGTPAAAGPLDAYFLEEDVGSVPGVYRLGSGLRTLRQAGAGGGWTYSFNSEGCRRLCLQGYVAGQGTVAVRADGGRWTAAASVDAPADSLVALEADLSRFLPATAVSVRFQAGAAGLSVAQLQVGYNAVPAGCRWPAAVRPARGAPWASAELPPSHPEVLTAVLGGATPSLQLVQVGAHQGDSLFHTAMLGGKGVEVFDPNTVSPTDPFTYLYFRVNAPGWIRSAPRTLWLTVTYADSPRGGQIHASYNSSDQAATLHGAYTSVGSPTLLPGGNGWTRQTWVLRDALFIGAQNFGADLRLSGTPGVAVHEVQLAQHAP
jgi:hypothetical protein